MKTKKSLLFISYEEARHICDKIQYGEATRMEQIKLFIRISWCNISRKYTQKNTQLTTLCQSANLKSLDKDKKDSLKKMLESKMSESKD
ncbi:hypothetical protein GTQ40_15080 [Flavobacteriaceae bacterium R38]|nr:hypothetical protein [Flavobacteriaceae bacterium R38]